MSGPSSDPVVGIVMGSDSDWPVMEPAALALEEFDVPYEAHVLSAHRTPRRMLDYAEAAAGRGLRVIIAGAGGAAHLPGHGRRRHPAAGHRRPPRRWTGSTAWTACCRSCRCPPACPVATVGIGGGRNAGLLAVRILAASDDALRAAVARFQADLADSVVARDAALQERLAAED